MECSAEERLSATGANVDAPFQNLLNILNHPLMHLVNRNGEKHNLKL